MDKIKMFIPLDEYYFNADGNVTTEVKRMSPREYIDKVALGFECTVQEILKAADESTVEYYAKCMAEGDEFPLIHLSYTDDIGFSQEGRHRAMAVQCLIDSKRVPRDTKIIVIEMTTTPTE